MNYLSQTVVLALPSTDVPLVYQHPMSHLLTSLPYIDEDVDSQVMAQVQKLIQDEMKIMPNKNYLENLRLKESRAERSQYLEGEMERLQKGTALENIDMERYNIDTFLPANKENDLAAIKNAVSKADCLSQHFNFK